MQELVKTGKLSEIIKQSDVKFWVNSIKLGAVSCLLSCILFNISIFAIINEIASALLAGSTQR